MKNNYTANSGIDVSETAMDIKILGKERKFFYPDNEFMKDIIVAALNGHDYPILHLPNYSTKTIVDIGANVGAAALYFLSFSLAFETVGESEVVNLVKVSEEITNKEIREISILKIDTEGCEIPVLEEFLMLENTDIGIIYNEYHSEEDRLAIDRLLSPDFMLFYSIANSIHRGNNGYISKDLCKIHPGIEWCKK